MITAEDIKELDIWTVEGKTQTLEPDRDAIKREVCVGGSEGGSCWNDAPSVGYRTGADINDATYDDLDNILEKFAPQVTFLQYKKLVKELSSPTDTRAGGYSDFYGNGTDMETQYIFLDDLAKYINENF